MHTVYRLTHAEYDRYRSHLLSLDEHSRYLRFGYSISDDMIDIICDKFEHDKNKHKIFVIEDNDLNIIGAGHIALDQEIELAFSVLKEHQGQGIGSALMRRCIEWCQNRNIKHGCMVCLSSNAAVKKMAKRHGVLIEQEGEALANIQIPEANPFSVINEVSSTNLANLDRLGKIQRKLTKMFTFPLQFS